jgi:hypothetical protein
MKDVTSTSFGLLMAYLLPGFVGLWSFTFWSTGLRKIFETFLVAQWQVGLFLLVLAAALITGLMVGAVRTVLVHLMIIHFDAPHLSAKSFRQLQNETKFSAFCYVVDENFRYHQFWAGMVLVMPAFFLGLAEELWKGLSCSKLICLIAIFLLVETLTCFASWSSYQKFVERATYILDGGE